MACGELALGKNLLVTRESRDERPNDVELVQVMLTHGATVNFQNPSGFTPLMYASECNRLKTARLLLDYGANVNAQNVYGATSLMFAAMFASLDLVRLLLEHGANVNLKDEQGRNALFNAMLAVRDKDIISELLAHGADPNVAERGTTPLKMAGNDPDIAALLKHYGAKE
jgi:ankyrin repeat protein